MTLYVTDRPQLPPGFPTHWALQPTLKKPFREDGPGGDEGVPVTLGCDFQASSQEFSLGEQGRGSDSWGWAHEAPLPPPHLS